MSAPVRPEPDQTRLHRLRTRLEELTESSFSPAGRSSAEFPPDADQAQGTPRWLTITMVGGAALLTLGLLLGYQSWSNRSAPPIDDQLPFLEAAEVDAAADTARPTEPPGKSPESTPEAASPPVALVDVIVHVAGAVSRPGVVTLPAGSRVYRAIELSGGAAADADLDRVNLAAPVIDGERIHVPEVGEDVPQVAPPTLSGSGPSTTPLVVDINSAEAMELEALPGIGPSLAQAIVTTRVQRGPFRSIEDLLEVPGIGEAKLAQLRDQITLS